MNNSHDIRTYFPKQTIQKIVDKMLEYQKINDIKGECLTNVSYLYSSIKENFPRLNPLVKSIVVYGLDENDNQGLIAGHVIIKLGDLLYDPSYEVSSLKHKVYFETLTEMKSILNFDKLEDGNERFKWSVEKMIKFNKFANEINGGEYLISDKQYLHKMADYVDLNFSK